MNKYPFVRDGVTRLPPGFRFQPTDEELVFQYLKSKLFSFPLPAPIIPHINICKYDPWDLPGDYMEQERYFFSNKEAKYRNGNRVNRATASGYWKATGSDKQIVPSSSSSSSSSSRINTQFLGMKKTLVFYRGKPPHDIRTDWVMHEYRLVSASSATQNNSKELQNWVICRIFMKKRSLRNEIGSGDNNPSSSCSSTSSPGRNISEVSSDSYDGESSSRNIF